MNIKIEKKNNNCKWEEEWLRKEQGNEEGSKDNERTENSSSVEGECRGH